MTTYQPLEGHEPSGFAALIDARWRCRDMRDGRRCQLLEHDAAVDHAHAEVLSRKPWRTVQHRWNGHQARTEVSGSERLPWCAMHLP